MTRLSEGQKDVESINVLLGVFQRWRSPRPSRKTKRTCKHPSSHCQCSMSGDMKGARVSNVMPPISAHEDLQEKWWKNKQTEVTQKCTTEGPPTRQEAQLSRWRRGTLRRGSSQTRSVKDLCASVWQNVDLHTAKKLNSPTAWWLKPRQRQELPRQHRTRVLEEVEDNGSSKTHVFSDESSNEMFSEALRQHSAERWIGHTNERRANVNIIENCHVLEIRCW